MAELFNRTDHRKIETIIAVNQLNPIMNDKKWVKLIRTLVGNFREIKECRVKLIWETDQELRRLKIEEFIRYNFDYYDTSMEAMISGKPKGWYAYKEIEWLDFPLLAVISKNTNIPTEQNLKLIQEIINKIGTFEMHIENENLRLYTYLQTTK